MASESWMGATSDLAAVILKSGKSALTSAEIAQAINNDEAPELDSAVARIMSLHPATIRTAKHVGEALSRMRLAGAPIGSTIGHGKVARWHVVGMRDPVRQAQQPVAQTTQLDPRVTSGNSDKLQELVRLTKRPISKTALCDALDLAPGKVDALLAEARSKGFDVDQAGDLVAWKQTTHEHQEVLPLAPAPTVGGRHILGLISDTHIASKWCKYDFLEDCVDYMYSRGVRTIAHSGDILDGFKQKINMWDVESHSFDGQADIAIEKLPQRPGLKWVAIVGNHDLWLGADNGMNVGRALVERFRSAGRDDLTVVGDCERLLQFGETRIQLLHPDGGPAYARSYPIQKYIRDLPSGAQAKPHILACGHRHMYVHTIERGIHAIECPSFKAPRDNWSKRKFPGGVIGGVLISWEHTKTGVVRRLAIEPQLYLEREVPLPCDETYLLSPTEAT